MAQDAVTHPEPSSGGVSGLGLPAYLCILLGMLDSEVLCSC